MRHLITPRHGLVLLALASCTTKSFNGGQGQDAADTGVLDAPDSTDAKSSPHHVFDYKTNGPQRLSIMFSMAWFGIATDDPQHPSGSDANYHNWAAGGTPCALAALSSPPPFPDPRKADNCILYKTDNACQTTSATPERQITSRRRPLTGIWSGTGRDAESKNKIDFLLSMVRRPGCRADDGAKLDAWTMQNNSIKFSSKYAASPNGSADLPYRTMMAMYARADANGVTDVIMPGFDATWYFNFGHTVGLGSCDDIKVGTTIPNPRSKCLDAITEDIRDLAIEAKQHPSTVKAHNGKPILFIYTDFSETEGQPNGKHQATTAEWLTILDNARVAAGTDFYVVASSNVAESFKAFDALAPWLGFGSYTHTGTNTIYEDSYAHTIGRHKALIAGVANYPERLVYGGVSPGFDDWTRNWDNPSNCRERQMPIGSPRNADFLRAQKDFFVNCKTGASCTSSTNTSYDFRGLVGETWDDWTEGSQFEPDVAGGTSSLVQLRGLIGQLFGDTYPDAAGDKSLHDHWYGYVKARTGVVTAPAGITHPTDLSCDP